MSLEGFVLSWAMKCQKHRQAPTIITTFEWFCVELSNEMPDLLLSYNSEQRRFNQQNRIKQVLKKKIQRSLNQTGSKSENATESESSRHKAGRAAPGLSCVARFERSAGVLADRGDLANQFADRAAS